MTLVKNINAAGLQAQKMINGSIAAVVTPLKRNSKIDTEAFSKLIDMHISHGTNALVVAGSTGESSTLSHDEHIQLISIAVERASGQIPIIAGVGANSTTEAISLAKEAKRVGSIAGLSVVPYYNKPTQMGLLNHFVEIAENSELPQILYDVPSRTGVALSDEVILELACHSLIVGLKDATADLGRLPKLIASLPSDFKLYSGDDETAMAFMASGGHGVISVSANVFPSLMRELSEKVMQGDIKSAQLLNIRLSHLHRELGIETNPIPIKFAMSKLGLIEGTLRKPLTSLDSKYHDQLCNTLNQLIN